MKKIKRKIARLKRNINKAPLSYYVAFSFGMIITFSFVMIVLFCLFQSIPDTLVTCWFGCWAGECLFCALIKCLKLKGDNNETEIDEP